MSARQRKRRESRRHRHAGATRRRVLAAGGLTAGATLVVASPAHALGTTYTVGTNADGTGATDCAVPTNTDCTLRQATIDANANGGQDAIVFASALSGSTITLTAGQLPINDPVTITGPGAGQLTIDGNGNDRIFYVKPGSTGDPVSISGLTLTNGYAATGGAIYNNNADLTLSHAVVSDSVAAGTKYAGGGIYSGGGSLTLDHTVVSGNDGYYGGGIGADSDVTITDSTISGNYAYGGGGSGYTNAYGGGVWIGGGSLDVESSTISDNVARDGGAIYANYSSNSAITISNSTIASNEARWDDAGAVWADGANTTLTVVDSTVTGNTALTDAGGLEKLGGSNPVLENSIVSGNSSGSNPDTDDLETDYAFDTAFSLIGVPSGYVNPTVPGSNITGQNPQLGLLQDNGGPTETMAPASSSPVVNKGKAFSLTTDQRGLTRPVLFPGVPNSSAPGADGSDIGAVELQLSPPPPPSTTGQRAAAVKKCKKKYRKAVQKKRARDQLTPKVKKHLKKKLRKCKRRANRLPV